MTADVAAVVVRYRGGDEVARCLAALVGSGGPRLAEICLVDSGSGDGGADRLDEDFPTVNVITLADNEGFAASANHGVAATTSSLILLLNPDTVIDLETVSTLARFLDQHPTAAAAVPLLVGMEGESQHRWQLRRLPTPWRLALGLSGAPAVGATPPTTARSVPQPAAAAWLIRRDVWNQLSGLDPFFAPAWWEDVDFCYRLDQRSRETGFQWPGGFWLEPAARVKHRGGASLDHLARAEFLTIFHRNLLRYAGRHHPDSAAVISATLRFALLLRAVVKPGQRRAWLQAARAVASNGDIGDSVVPPG